MSEIPFTPTTLAKLCGCSEGTIYRMIADGEIKSFKLGDRLVRIPANEGEKAKSIVGRMLEKRGRRAQKHRVYFVRCGGFIKIGLATNVRKRLLCLQTHSPHEMTLLMDSHGSVAVEREYHKRFATNHHKNEWFRLEGDLLVYLRDMGCDV